MPQILSREFDELADVMTLEGINKRRHTGTSIQCSCLALHLRSNTDIMPDPGPKTTDHDLANMGFDTMRVWNTLNTVREGTLQKVHLNDLFCEHYQSVQFYNPSRTHSHTVL